ncbi:CDP-diacylglycerol--serine O-phosphatidyltransferase [Congregibacter litoralis]|uniref:CDP-diacylglycerol--serine O-phosphatidyltransferase n=1 Tax=Congregibacter litoralis KT71 TaxID=314285 RepID=A4ADS7_9GAMM|nr:CDP-diacylglycerol--serine O-phosphatidyltransferase [Congregibacter litoralis KT71]
MADQDPKNETADVPASKEDRHDEAAPLAPVNDGNDGNEGKETTGPASLLPDSLGEAASSIENLIEDHEEEVSENGRTVKRRGVYLLPNLFTTGALFCGFYAVVAAMRGDYETAPIAILFALVFDGLDGRVARMTNTSSKFGAEYDSLADMVSFGVAPALVMFSWALGDLGKAGWSAAFVYVACAALRLARFNTQVGVGDPNFFMGLASPAAACIMACTVWVCQDQGWVGAALPLELAVLVAALTGTVAILMVVNVPYHSFKGFDLHGRVPFVAILAVVLVFGLVTVDPPKILLLASLAYALSGPVEQLRRWQK